LIELHDVLAGIVVAAGLIGIVVVFLPGLALQLAAVLLWTLEENTVVAWIVLTLVTVLAVAATVCKYTRPGRRLREAGIPGWLLFGAVGAAVVGLFAVPVIGAPLFFVATIYLFERARRGKAAAWPSTRLAIRAVLASIGIELAGGFLILLVFAAAALLT
jgi:hypothetical protein